VQLICQADDEGRGLWDADQFRALIYAYQPKVKVDQVIAAMQEILLRGLEVIYRHGERSYYQLHDWHEHQRIEHPTPSSMPGPHAEDSCILLSAHEESRDLTSNTFMSPQEDPGGLTGVHADRNGSEWIGSEGKGSDLYTRAREAAAAVVRKESESQMLLDFWYKMFQEKFGQVPAVEGARDLLAAKAILGGRTLDQAKAIVAFHLNHPAPFYAEKKLYGLHHIRKDASQIVARMAANGKPDPSEIPAGTRRTLQAAAQFAREGKDRR
jgi:hypothetical protein